MSFESFGELHFRPTFDAGAVRRCIAIVRAIQADCLARLDLAKNVIRQNSQKTNNMLPNCTTLCIMNKTTKQKQNAQPETYDYDFKTKLKCTTVQTDAAR